MDVNSISISIQGGCVLDEEVDYIWMHFGCKSGWVLNEFSLMGMCFGCVLMNFDYLGCVLDERGFSFRLIFISSGCILMQKVD
jgi:hypothetical protein